MNYKFYFQVIDKISTEYDDYTKWQKELCHQAQELDENLGILDEYTYLNNTNFDCLPKEDRELIIMQKEKMAELLTIMITRIENFKIL